ncbi:unnamed protein product [Effrenium voratum]|nr:unnamed protein product [Effrenium voratum]
MAHAVLSWVMVLSFVPDSDGLVRVESMSSITQAWWLAEQAASANVRHICEVGFNAGHSAFAMLLSADARTAGREEALWDLAHVSLLATARSLVVMDDIGCSSAFCEGPTRAWRRFLGAGRVRQLGCQQETERSWCWGSFLF